MYGKKNCNLTTLSREYDCLAKIGSKEAFTLLLENRRLQMCRKKGEGVGSKGALTKIYLLRAMSLVTEDHRKF